MYATNKKQITFTYVDMTARSDTKRDLTYAKSDFSPGVLAAKILFTLERNKLYVNLVTHPTISHWGQVGQYETC
jgi:hypothetical protein